MAKKNNLSGCTRIRIKTAIDAEIVRADTFSIETETGPLSPVRIRRRKETITISRPWRWFVFRTFFTLNRAHVKIGLPQLLELAICDNSSAGVAGFNSSDEFKLTLSETSSFAGELVTGDFLMDISGSSQAEFSGSSANLFLKVKNSSSFAADIVVNGKSEIEVSSNSAIALAGSAANITADINNISNADMSDFPAHDININVYRLCNVTIRLDGSLDASIAGSSNVSWLGNPTMGTIKVTTGSLLHQS